MNDTKIEWADDTVNPWWGCVRVSPACEHCYAEALDKRVGGHHWGPTAPRRLRVEKAIAELRKIERRAEKEGRPRRVFIASMSDVFEDRADLVEPRAQLWDALHALSGWVVPMLLTKRPAVMAAWAAEHGWPKHAWAGTTVEDQRRADERIPHLLRVPAAVRFLSCEPLLGPVDLGLLEPEDSGEIACDVDPEFGPYPTGPIPCPRRDLLHWVITGGESGPRARPSHPDWFRSLRDQCEDAGVPYLHKQNGEWARAGTGDLPTLKVVQTDPRFRVWFWDGERIDASVRVGKHAAGRLLDGRTHDEFPEVTGG